MNLKVVRDACGQYASLGKMYVNDEYQCETLEDVDRKLEDGGVKIPCETAIPRGTYKVIVDWSPHFNRMLPHVLDVPDYEGVRIHPGNAPKDTEGCILVGMRRGPNYVYQSVNAFNALMDKIDAALDAGEDITLEVA